MNIFRSLYAASFLAILAVSAGCGGESSDVVDDNGKTISDVHITPGIDGLTKGSKMQFKATVDYADGTSADVTSNRGTIWNTSNPDVATVTNDGLATAVDEGKVDITANYKSVTNDETFLVTP